MFTCCNIHIQYFFIDRNIMVSTTGFVILVSLCIAGSLAIEWRHLRATFTLFHEIPLTLDGLMQSKNYSLMVRDKDLHLDFYCFKNDPRVSVGVDSYGNIGGIRVSFIKSDLPTKGNAKNRSFPAFFKNKPLYSSGTFLHTEVYYTDILFTHPDALRAGGRRETKGLVGEDVYLKLNGKWNAMPKKECEAKSKGFTLQACYRVMGLHYFYKMSPDIDCVDLQPVFGLYENGEMIGMGVATFGAKTNTPDRIWLEDVPKSMFSEIVPRRPNCMMDWLEDYGLITLHLFFKEVPTTTPCAESVCQT